MLDWNMNLVAYGLEFGMDFKSLAGPDLKLCEAPVQGRLLLRTRLNAADARTHVSRTAGIELPLEPNTASGGEYPALWIGPGRWLINMPGGDMPATRAKIASALEGGTFLLSDVSHSRFVIGLSGRRAPELMSRLCPLDLDEKAFATDLCAQSLLARVPMLIHRLGNEPQFHLYVDRSHAHYAWDWLTDAALSMGAKEGDA
jgi:sarcosine oxidase subunit gamma